jgi:hypothetical protein
VGNKFQSGVGTRTSQWEGPGWIHRFSASGAEGGSVGGRGDLTGQVGSYGKLPLLFKSVSEWCP